MATIEEVSTPEQAWGFVSHFLGNRLAKGLYMDRDDDYRESLNTNRRYVVDKFEIIVRQLRRNGHAGAADQVQHLIDLVRNGDFSTLDIIDTIHAKHAEFNPSVNEVAAYVAKLKAEGKLG